MNRRAFLYLGAGLLGTYGTYLGWNQFRYPNVPDGIDIDTLYVSGNVFGEPATEDQDLRPGETYHRIIGNEETATDEINFDDSALEFAKATDFDDEYLIVVQTGMQTEPDLALEAVSREDSGLHLEVAVEHPWWRGVNDDLGTHSLLIRITDGTEEIPDSVSVEIEGYV